MSLDSHFDTLYPEVRENRFFRATGQLARENEKKFEYYFDCVYQKLPTLIQFFMSKNAIAKKLEEWYIQVKDLLDNGVMDDSAKIGEAKDIE